MQLRRYELEVSDHALVRYIERVVGADVEAAREHLAQLTARGAALGAAAVVAEGARFVLRDVGLTASGKTRVKLTTVLPHTTHWLMLDQ